VPWTASWAQAGLAKACHGLTSARLPLTMLKPAGVFIQALALMTNTAEAAAARVSGMVQRKRVLRDSRRSP